MTMMMSYIGYLDDPSFDFYNGNYSGNIPERQSPELPNAHEIHSVLWKLKDNSEYEIRKLDWGAIGAKMTKQQLKDFIESLDNRRRFREITQFIQELDADKTYVLVAFEID